MYNLFEEQPLTTESGNETNQVPKKDCRWNRFKNRGLHFLHLNINSPLPKIDDLGRIAKNSNTAIIGITESKLNKAVLDNEVEIDGYELKRADRKRQGGGAGCCIRKDLSFNVRGKFSAVSSVFHK